METQFNSSQRMPPIFKPGKRVTSGQLSKALAVYGYTTWDKFEPDEDKKRSSKLRDKLNRKFFSACMEIDEKKARDFNLQKKLNAMPKWQKEDYLKKNPESGLGKHKQLIHKLKTEERALHEAYQILLSEHHIRKKLRKRQEELEEQMAENGKGGKSKYGAKKTINIDNAELDEEGDSKVEEFATMAEQIAAQTKAGMQDDSSSDSSDEEEENAENNMDIFADDMALGEEASTLESHPSKSDDTHSKLNQVSKILEKKNLSRAFSGRKK